MQSEDDSQHGGRCHTTLVSASFLRTPGPRRQQHKLQHLATNPLPTSSPTKGQGAFSKGKDLRQPRMVLPLHPKPSIAHERTGHRQRKSSRRVQIVALSGQPFSSQGPSPQQVHMIEVVATSSSNLLQLPVSALSAVDEVVVATKLAERSVATLKVSSKEQHTSDTSAQDAVPGGHAMAKTPSIAPTIRNDEVNGQSHPSGSVGNARKGKEACYTFFTTPKWLLLPWVLLVCFTFVVAVLAMIIIDNIKSSYEFLLWPWYNSFLQSLIYALSVQDLPLIFLCSLRSRKHAPTTTPTPSERSSDMYDDSMDDLEDDVGGDHSDTAMMTITMP